MDWMHTPAARDDGRGSATERVQAAVRDAIINLDLAPGSLIDKAALCEQFGVSRFPVSDALARLQAEGLVEILPQRGTRVSRISMFEVRQAMFIRRALEVDMIRALAASIPDAVLSQVEMNLHSQRLAVRKGDARTFHELDLAFHRILLDCLGYPRATAAIDASRSSLDRARRMLSSPRRHADTLAEHEPIFTSLRNHDTDGAVRTMSDHLDAVLAELMALMRSRPDVFDHGP